MASLIPGYEYDIFISYRQKDNKGERWVSNFVEALKTELESTFKEEVSVYFDINPHDGLLDTHDVDASLREKLKCLVFIPIISRTYCDPGSFAWKYEFIAFIEQASKDRFGLKVRLPNGNVAGRVLPVRIHELDNEDLVLCESALGGPMRGVEFIYNEPGINKPLTIGDNEAINLNRTKYRNQINKCANAIREVISALKKSNQTIGDIPVEAPASKFRLTRWVRNKYKLLLLVSLIVISGIFLSENILNLFTGRNRIIRNESVIHVEVVNKTDDPARIIRSDIIEYLVKFNLSNKCKLTLLDEKQFRKIYPHEKGTINLPAKNIRIKIVNAVFLNQDEIEWKIIDNKTRSVTENKTNFRDHIELLNFKGNLSLVLADLTDDKTDKDFLTNDWTSFINYYDGERAWSEINKVDAKIYFSNSIEADSSFVLPRLRLAKIYHHERNNKSAKEVIDIVIRSIDKLTIPDSIRSRALWHTLKMETKEAIENYLQMVAYLPAMKESYFELAEAYFRICDIENATINYINALTIDPDFTLAHNHLAYCYCAAGKHDSALLHVKKYLKLDPSANSWDSYGDILFAMGDLGSAVWAKNNGLQIDPRRDYLYESLAYINVQQGNIKGALENIDKYVSLQRDPFFINKGLTDKAFIYFLKKEYGKSLDTCLMAKKVFDTRDLLTRNHVLHWLMCKIYLETDDNLSLKSEMKEMEDIIKKNNVNKFRNYNMIFKFYQDIRIHQLFKEKKIEEAKSLIRIFDDEIYEKVKDWNYPFDIAFFNSEFGKLYLEADSINLAKERFEKALEYNSRYKFAHLGLSVVYKRKGNENEYKFHYNEFINATQGADPELFTLFVNEYGKLIKGHTN